MIEFAGIKLLKPDSQGHLAEHLRRCDLDRLALFGRQPLATGWDQRNNPRCAWEPEVCLPLPNWPDPPPLSINRLYWPTGATRWATFVGLVNRDGLDQILASVLSARADNKAIQSANLIINEIDYVGAVTPPGWHRDANKKHSVTVEMCLLPPRPVAMFDGHPAEQLWFIPLVDERYWWQYRKLPTRYDWILSQDHSDIFGNDDPTVTGLKETWIGWVRILSYALGLWDRQHDKRILFDIDAPQGKPHTDATPEADYFFPDRTELDRLAYNAAAVLDALAWSCGRRVIRTLKGATYLQSVADAATYHAANLTSFRNIGGGPATLVPGDKSQPKEGRDVADNIVDDTGYMFSQAHPEFVDVTFRKTVEWGESSDWPDENDNDNPGRPSDHPAYSDLRVFYGPGMRTIRTAARHAWHELQTYMPGAVKAIHTPSWVGRVWYEKGVDPSTEEPRGKIDLSTYGDRYFRLAYLIARDYHRWLSQQHEYQFAGFEQWTMTGFDDALEIDAERGVTHVRALPADVGVNTMLVQVHRQCAYRPDFFVGIVTSEWTAHPKNLEPRTTDGTCSLQGADGPETEIWLDPCEIGVDADFWARSWQWISASARPLIPCDPWASDNSIEFGKRFAHLGDSVTVTVRSRKLVQQLLALLGCAIVVDEDGVPILDSDGNVIFDRTDCLTTASGLVTAERYGCEWVVTSIECN